MKTWGDVCDAYLECKTKKEANEFLRNEIERIVSERNMTREEAESFLRSSLGYMMGYYPDHIAFRMQKLLDLTHPILPWVGKKPTTSKNLRKAYRIGLKGWNTKK